MFQLGNTRPLYSLLVQFCFSSQIQTKDLCENNRLAWPREHASKEKHRTSSSYLFYEQPLSSLKGGGKSKTWASKLSFARRFNMRGKKENRFFSFPHVTSLHGRRLLPGLNTSMKRSPCQGTQYEGKERKLPPVLVCFAHSIRPERTKRLVRV